MFKQIRDLVQAGPMFISVLVLIGFCLLWVPLISGCSSQKEDEAAKAAVAAAEQAEVDAYNQNLLKGLPVGCTLTYLGRYKMSRYSNMPITVVQCKGADVVTTNSLPNCGKYGCPEATVQITNK